MRRALGVAVALCWLGGATTLTACSTGPTASAPQPQASSTSRSPEVEPGSRDDLTEFARTCSERVESRSGQVDYPARLEVGLDESTTYGAAIDVRSAPGPAERVISSATATSEQIIVQCQVDARLVAVGEGLEVTGGDESNGGWRPQRFSSSGVVEWSWTVEAVDLPRDQQLRLELRPAVREQGGELMSSASTVVLTTAVEVQATVVERAGRWFTTQWPIVLTIAACLGAAAAGLVAWVGHLRRSVEEAVRRKAASDAQALADGDVQPDGHAAAGPKPSPTGGDDGASSSENRAGAARPQAPPGDGG